MSGLRYSKSQRRYDVAPVEVIRAGMRQPLRQTRKRAFSSETGRYADEQPLNWNVHKNAQPRQGN
jgi:hypothetical protein